MGIGQVPGVVALTVVAEDVPFLLPVNLLRALKANVDLSENRLHLRAINTDCVMNVLPSGHPTVSVLDFGSGWFLPEVCRGHVPESAFRSAPKQVQFSMRPHGHDHSCSPSAQATLATFSVSPDVRRSGIACSTRAAMGRDHTRSQPTTRPRALARVVGQGLVCASMGALPVCDGPVASASCARALDFGDLYHGKFLEDTGAGGGHGQRAGVPQLLGEQEAQRHGSGEGSARGRCQQMSPMCKSRWNCLQGRLPS